MLPKEVVANEPVRRWPLMIGQVLPADGVPSVLTRRPPLMTTVPPTMPVYVVVLASMVTARLAEEPWLYVP